MGEIFWCRVGLNVGVEEDGKNSEFVRPVLVIKKFSHEIVLGIPLTTKEKAGDWYYPLPHFGKNSYLVLNQVKSFDTKRFLSSMGQISENELEKIINSLFKLVKS